MQKICEYCGDPYEARSSKQRFCGRKCGYAGRGKRAKLSFIPRKNKKLYLNVCKYCKKEFETVYKPQKYCSKDCMIKQNNLDKKNFLNIDQEDITQWLETYRFDNAVLGTYVTAQIREGLTPYQEAKENRFWGKIEGGMELFAQKFDVQVQERFEQMLEERVKMIA